MKAILFVTEVRQLSANRRSKTFHYPFQASRQDHLVPYNGLICKEIVASKIVAHSSGQKIALISSEITAGQRNLAANQTTKHQRIADLHWGHDLMKANLSGKVALVTGGSRSIGAAISKKLAADGAAICLTYSSSSESAAQVVDAIEANGGKALAIRADAADTNAVRSAVSQAVKTFGRLDILVNNAGILILKPLNEIAIEDFDRMLAVNVRGMFSAIQEAARHMPEGGRIINIGSINSEYVPFMGGSLYALTKAAVAGLTKGLARELGAKGVTINNVQPGPTDTDMNPDSGPFAEQARSYTALARYAQASEIADFVAYLASPGAGFITGSSLRIDGGYAA